jgi:hypothetical protein
MLGAEIAVATPSEHEMVASQYNHLGREDTAWNAVASARHVKVSLESDKEQPQNLHEVHVRARM